MGGAHKGAGQKSPGQRRKGDTQETGSESDTRGAKASELQAVRQRGKNRGKRALEVSPIAVSVKGFQSSLVHQTGHLVVVWCQELATQEEEGGTQEGEGGGGGLNMMLMDDIGAQTQALVASQGEGTQEEEEEEEAPEGERGPKEKAGVIGTTIPYL